MGGLCDDVVVRVQRLLFVAAGLLLVVVVLVSLGERENAADQAVAPPPAAAGPPAPVVEGALPADRVVEAQPGDLVRLTVSTKQVAEVAIPGLGISAVATPEQPATLEATAPEPGRYPVVVEGPGTRLGTLSVERPR